ncbi:TspO/MBR-related protein [Apiospora arundinis]|uniref:TspO/MBR-related protein n=1 Tax=Apiospora arundinis TaxID=335852 RepID=A0ABR2J5D5_9PEZI
MTTYIPQITIPNQVFSNAAASVLLPIALGTGVGFSITPSKTKDTYRLMKQPPLRPPPWVFGPAWTTLYGLMGYAAHRAITSGLNPLTSSVEGVRDAKHAATLYTIQLGLNLAWTPLFFGLRKPVAALVDIVALLGLNSYLTYQFFQLDTTAGWCMVPYVAWLTFATYLNTGVGVMNNWRITDEDLLKKRNE